MDTKSFWKLIDEAREKTSNLDEMYHSLVNKLSQQDIAEILTWHHMFWEYQRLSYKSKLWAAAYVINGGCSDDGFDYFRGWLTAQGKAVFMQALRDPDYLAEVVDVDDEGGVGFEMMLSVASAAYFQKLKMEEHKYDEFDRDAKKHTLPDETKNALHAEIIYAQDIDTAWDEDDQSAMHERLPKLCQKFDW